MASHSGGAENHPGRYRFGDIEVDAAAHGVTRAGAPLALEPKAFAVLMVLLERPGELVPRDALLDQVWGHRHVTPGVLTRAVAQLRSALGDDPQHPRYIQTRHALGYSFIGDLGPGAAPAPAPVAGPAANVEHREVTDRSGEAEEAAPAPPAAIVCSADVRRLVRQLLELRFRRLPVLSFQELVGDVEVMPVGTVKLGSG